MNQWVNRHHPPTLQAGVILGYISAVFGALGFGSFLPLLAVYLGMFAGAYGTANNKRWGYTLLAICSWLTALFLISLLLLAVLNGNALENILARLNNTVFPTALAMAVVHTQSREYQKVWFE
jgi:hypothetical protein